MKAPTREEKIASCLESLIAKPEFPTFSHHIQKILAAVEDNESTVRELTEIIMRDYSLSLKLLRAANIYNLSGRQILNLSHAVIMIGTEGVRNLASSLLIFEHFFKKPAGIRELMMLSMLSANHVREIATRVGTLRPEEAYLCGMVRNLGEVLIGYYQPGPYAKILQRMAERKQTASAAAIDVLQFTFEDIGEAVIRYWRMPEVVAACQQPQAPPGSARGSPEGLMHAAVTLGHRLTTAVYRMDPKEGADQLKACIREQSLLLPIQRHEVEEILKVGLSDTQESFSAMGVQLDELRLETQTRSAVEALLDIPPTPPAEANPSSAAGDLLERMAKEVSALLDSDAELEFNSLILKVLNAVHQGAGFDRAIFAFLTEDRTAIEGRIGVGEQVDSLIENFRFRMSLAGGPVALALLSKHNVVGDAVEGEAAKVSRIFGSSYVCLFPVIVARQAIGCIYAESRTPRPDLTSHELAILEDLRDSVTAMIERLKRRAKSGTAKAGIGG